MVEVIDEVDRMTVRSREEGILIYPCPVLCHKDWIPAEDLVSSSSPVGGAISLDYCYTHRLNVVQVRGNDDGLAVVVGVSGSVDRCCCCCCGREEIADAEEKGIEELDQNLTST